ncbi:MAG: MBL fold metallo-hydrolase [Deltaproteobacteria bacterium]|jgi:glyoxylase-like metal-dependent hydrolase (beta-lactamase superfamily II)|nr:MBL fold metallo-hydrolase [Deltaproteobacteria bacterium]
MLKTVLLLPALFFLVWQSSVRAEAAGDGFIDPGVFKKTLGQLEIYALSDSRGRLDFSIMLGISKDQIKSLIGQNPELDDNSVASYINAFLVKCPAGLILVDTGLGNGDILKDAIIKASFKPEDVTDVILTHFHGDHINGLLTGTKPLFPNATVWAEKEEDTYWLKQGAGNRGRSAEEKIFPYRRDGKYKLFAAGDEIKPGVLTVPLYGHTPGHTGFLFKSGTDEDLLTWGDIVHAYLVQFAEPKVSMTYDVDPEEAAKTRTGIMQKSAEAGCLVGGAHLPFPGLGHVKVKDSAFSWEKEQ